MHDEYSALWKVTYSTKAAKLRSKLPKRIQEIMDLLVIEIERAAPVRNNWPNFGLLKGKESTYHCHIKKGHPTYVSCWYVIDKKMKHVEIIYVGTHEKAPY